MKTLFIVRHAEPDRSEQYEYDFDYPLTRKGRTDAINQAARLKQENVTIDTIVASSAIRTAETAGILAEGLGCRELVTLKELYLADVEQIAKIVRDTAQKINSLMVVAHNPGITDFVDCFSDKLIDWMQPGDLVAIELPDVPWLEFQSGVISKMYSPEDI